MASKQVAKIDHCGYLRTFLKLLSLRAKTTAQVLEKRAFLCLVNQELRRLSTVGSHEILIRMWQTQPGLSRTTCQASRPDGNNVFPALPKHPTTTRHRSRRSDAARAFSFEQSVLS